MAWVIRAEGRASRSKPLASLRHSLAPYRSCKGDKQALARPGVEGLFLESLLVRGPESCQMN